MMNLTPSFDEESSSLSHLVSGIDNARYPRQRIPLAPSDRRKVAPTVKATASDKAKARVEGNTPRSKAVVGKTILPYADCYTWPRKPMSTAPVERVQPSQEDRSVLIIDDGAGALRAHEKFYYSAAQSYLESATQVPIAPPPPPFEVGSARYVSPSRTRMTSNPTVLSALMTNPEAATGPSDLPPAIQLLRVCLCHLRSIGAAPWLLDIRYYSDHVILELSPEAVLELAQVDLPNARQDSFLLPACFVTVYPQLSTHRSVLSAMVNGAGRNHEVDLAPPVLHRFFDCPESCDKDLVICFSRPEAAERQLPIAQPWEPAFLEQCVAQLFLGERQSMNELRLSMTDSIFHESVVSTGIPPIPLHAMNAFRPKYGLEKRSRRFKRYAAMDMSEAELLGLADSHEASAGSDASGNSNNVKRKSSMDTKKQEMASPSDPHWIHWSRFAVDLQNAVIQCCRRIWYLNCVQG
jgi:hypothetical protein